MRGDFLENKVAELRKIHNMTQEQMAESLRVSRQTINSIEKDRYNPSIMLAFRIARLFDKTIEEIFIYREEDANEN